MWKQKKGLHFRVSRMKKTPRITIGRVDKADFPELHLEDLDVKVDTGAYTSSIHCYKIEEFEKDGQKCIRFELLDPDHPNYNHKKFVFTDYEERVIKSSFGTQEERFAIKTTIELFGKSFPILLTLSERSDMKYPILLGRKFLTKRFVVDTAKKNLSQKFKEISKNENSNPL